MTLPKFTRSNVFVVPVTMLKAVEKLGCLYCPILETYYENGVARFDIKSSGSAIRNADDLASIEAVLVELNVNRNNR